MMSITEQTATGRRQAVNTIGVLGQHWRATVSPAGTVEVWDGLPALRWHVAADDRWHTPETEPAVRQTALGGTPVIETRLRIPHGDAIHRVYAVADQGGLTVIEVENDSPSAIAVAFTGAALLSLRPSTGTKVVGLDLPDDAMLFPIGHHATLTVAMAHGPQGDGSLPVSLPTAQQVANGWSTMTDRASRLRLPDLAISSAVTHERCELLLGGPVHADVDAECFLIGVAELVRLGRCPDDWVVEVADAVHRLSRRPDAWDAWDARAAFDAAERILTQAGERRAVSDLARLRSIAAGSPDAVMRLSSMPGDELPGIVPNGARLIAWAERRLAISGALMPVGMPLGWLGQNFEVFDVPTGPASAVSFALRWHGDRPAVLWERRGRPIALTSPVLAPGWTSTEVTGEALWPVAFGRQPGSAAQTAVAGDPISFS